MFIPIWATLLFTVRINNANTVYPKILNSSGCIHLSEVLTCMCISQGSPLPTIKWPLLENYTDYSVITTISNHTVNSTVILAVKDQSNTVVECVSSRNEDVRKNLMINKVEQEEGQIMKLLRIMTQLRVIIAFLIGALLSAIICCLVKNCHRKKHGTYGNMADVLEMVTSHEVRLIDAGQAVENYQAVDQEAAEGGEAVVAGKSDVEYSNLDFSRIKRENPAGAGTTQETSETEYAEIKREEGEERQDGECIDVEMHCVPDEKEGGEDVTLYSNVRDVRFEDSIA